eukprot:6658184-Heterocapsa_arctica.AAC.1
MEKGGVPSDHVLRQRVRELVRRGRELLRHVLPADGCHEVLDGHELPLSACGVLNALPQGHLYRVADHSSHGVAKVPFQDCSCGALLVGDQVHVKLAEEFSARPEGSL